MKTIPEFLAFLGKLREASIHFTLQTVDPDLLARSANSFSRTAATSDSDIIAYTLFAVDVDPVRKTGISATDEEKAHALEVIL